MAEPVYRRRCGSCGATFEGGQVVLDTYSCEVCGAGSLGPAQEIVTGDQAGRMPRSGGEGLITHTRDNF